MSVEKFVLPSSQVDNDLSVLARIAAAFAPHASDPPALALVVDRGHFLAAGDLIETPVQLADGFVVPTTQPRIDRVVVDGSGIAVVVSGTEASDPVPPAIPFGAIPVGQVRLEPGSTAITNKMIVDERDFSGINQSQAATMTSQRFTSSGTYTPTSGTTVVIVELVGGGGSGGSCASPGASQGAAGGGGSSGAFARTRLVSGFAGVAVTVGSGGAAPGAGAIAGNSGTASSFGGLTAAAGSGGSAGGAFAAPVIAGGASAASAPSGANLVAASGAPGGHGYVLSQFVVVGGNGGNSFYGGGGNGGGNTAGLTSQSPGGGGGGASSIGSAPARQGGAGASGMVTIYEFN